MEPVPDLCGGRSVSREKLEVDEHGQDQGEQDPGKEAGPERVERRHSGTLPTPAAGQVSMAVLASHGADRYRLAAEGTTGGLLGYRHGLLIARQPTKANKKRAGGVRLHNGGLFTPRLVRSAEPVQVQFGEQGVADPAVFEELCFTWI